MLHYPKVGVDVRCLMQGSPWSLKYSVDWGVINDLWNEDRCWNVQVFSPRGVVPIRLQFLDLPFDFPLVCKDLHDWETRAFIHDVKRIFTDDTCLLSNLRFLTRMWTGVGDVAKYAKDIIDAKSRPRSQFAK
jgi:hypothetical protein